MSSFNDRARAFYLRLGFEVVGEIQDFFVAGHSEWMLRKTRGPKTTYEPGDGVVHHAHLGGASLAYVEHGSGVPVVFVHGASGDWRSWSAHLAAFAPKYRAVSYSRRGHYGSE